MKVKEYAAANPNVKCDLWSIDRDHRHGAELDFEGAALMSARRSFVIANDHHASDFEKWHRWEVSKKLRSIYCKSDDGNYQGHSRGWCFGRFILVAGRGRDNLSPGEKNSGAACKYMVYTVLGAQRRFNDLAVMMVRSLFASILRNPPTCSVDIFILTDRENFKAMQPLVDMFGVRLHES